MTQIGFDLSANETTPFLPIGTVVTNEESGEQYVAVQIYASSANACSAGRVFYKTTTYGVVSDDVSEINCNEPAGVGIGTIALGSYGFLLIDGYAAALKKSLHTGVSATAKDVLQGDPTQDGCAGRKTAGVAPTRTPIGVVAATVTGLAATCTAYIHLAGQWGNGQGHCS